MLSVAVSVGVGEMLGAVGYNVSFYQVITFPHCVDVPTQKKRNPPVKLGLSVPDETWMEPCAGETGLGLMLLFPFREHGSPVSGALLKNPHENLRISVTCDFSH